MPFGSSPALLPPYKFFTQWRPAIMLRSHHPAAGTFCACIQKPALSTHTCQLSSGP